MSLLNRHRSVVALDVKPKRSYQKAAGKLAEVGPNTMYQL